ncbi:hypothetical protein SFR_5744 [Streptomyces sp. FR-008]|nr:hypothetical protein SFR_5744 [Streptomyces sp. FR-008]
MSRPPGVCCKSDTMRGRGVRGPAARCVGCDVAAARTWRPGIA